MPDHPKIPYFVALTTYLSYAILIVFGHLRDFFGRLFGISRYLLTKPPPGYAPLLKSWENFYTRRLYHRIQDCFNRPINTNPAARIGVLERISKDGMKTMEIKSPETSIPCLNLGSYNYLGFADDWKETCSRAVYEALDSFPVTCNSARSELGTTIIHKELEETVARFVGKKSALVFNMGFGTNATTIPVLVGKGSLIISDSLNHSSIVTGCRASGAAIRVFAHNDPSDLEKVLRRSIAEGQPRNRRPWDKILVMVEGIYSMEGEICELKGIVRVCKQYKAYIYLDEAHSIGALGPTGRGVCEHCGVDPADVDILMGTFTKSFGGMGGYIASSPALIQHLKRNCAAYIYHSSMSPIVCAQVLRALKVIMGEDESGGAVGRGKLVRLKENSNFVRREFEKIGLHVYGDYDSPVIPLLLYNPSKIAAFSRECLKRHVAVVVVGFPATPLVESRARICISAGHTMADLKEAVRVIDEVAGLLKLRYAISWTG